MTPLLLVDQVYGVSISVKNASHTDWMPSDVSLRQTSPSTTWFQNQYGHPLSGEENSVLLPQTVRAGGQVALTFQVRAPAISSNATSFFDQIESDMGTTIGDRRERDKETRWIFH